MATVASIITSARYDLRDDDDTQYSDEMMLEFLNRGLRPLCAALAALRSDWVNEAEDLTLASAASTVTLPTLFLSPISVRIGTEDLVKKSVSWIREELLDSSSGQPDYYAIRATVMMFERVADAEYTVRLEYNKGVAALTASGNMPLNDEFNDVLRQFLVISAKNRNEYSVMTDAALQDFFMDALSSKYVARNYNPNPYRTDF